MMQPEAILTDCEMLAGVGTAVIAVFWAVHTLLKNAPCSVDAALPYLSDDAFHKIRIAISRLLDAAMEDKALRQLPAIGSSSYFDAAHELAQATCTEDIFQELLHIKLYRN